LADPEKLHTATDVVVRNDGAPRAVGLYESGGDRAAPQGELSRGLE
jgi:hypothetical protein